MAIVTNVKFTGMVSGIGVKESGNEPKKAGWECYAVGTSRLLRKKRHNSVSDGRTRTALLGSDAMVGNEKFEHDTLYQQGREQIEIAYLQAVRRGVSDPVVIRSPRDEGTRPLEVSCER